MAAAIWMVLAVGTMAGIFAVCVAIVVAGVRVLERIVATRREKHTA